METSRIKLGIRFFSTEVDVTRIRPMDLFAIAQDMFDCDGERLGNSEVALELKRLGRTDVEIVMDPKYKYTLTVKK